jgi:hypothetical protein
MGSILSFLKTHKWKILIFTVVGIGGSGYLAYRFLMNMKQQLEESLKKHQISMQKQRDLERLRMECSDTMTNDFMAPLRKELHKLTDPRQVTMQLKDLRGKAKKGEKVDENEMDQLWEDLKVFSITRLVGSVYALVLMDLLVRIQVHIANKAAFDNNNTTAITTTTTTTSTDQPINLQIRQGFMLKATDFFVHQGGLKTLLDRVSAGVRVATKKWNMGSEAKVSRTEILEMIRAIRMEIEQNSGNDNGISQSTHQWFLSCLIQPDDTLANVKKVAGSSIGQLLDETMDWLESPHFIAALEEALGVVFSALLDELASRQFEVSNTLNSKKTGSDNISATTTTTTSTSTEERFVLAKVIVSMNASDVLTSTSNVTTSNNEKSSTSEDKNEPVMELTVSGQTLIPTAATTTTTSTTNVNRYVKLIENLPMLLTLCKAILQFEDVDSALGGGGGGGVPGDLNSLAGLLGGAGGAGGANPNDPMAMLLSNLLGGGNGGGNLAGLLNGPPPAALQPQLLQQLGLPPMLPGATSSEQAISSR